jgi:hypothetical protein
MAAKWRKFGPLAIAFGLGALLVVPVAAVQFSAQVRRALPSPTPDGSGAVARFGRYGELYSVPLTAGTYGIADEGSYFQASTATPGTAFNLTGATQNAFVATTPTFTVKNNDAENAKRLYIDFVRIVFATPGTAGTRIEGAAVIDSTTRYSSGGTALSAFNVNMDTGTATISTQAFGGAITATAAGINTRVVCRFTLKTAIAIAGDSMMVNFGQVTTSGITAASPPVATCPPAVIGGGDAFLLYTWQPSQTATPTGEVAAAWWER